MYVHCTDIAYTPLEHVTQLTAHNVAAVQNTWLQDRFLHVHALHRYLTRFADLFPMHGAYQFCRTSTSHPLAGFHAAPMLHGCILK